ncbi:hypothetical protein B296_00037432 [Ensete ventricosum]|uniref:Uncharacterized protein n=1 Tax=Ensete ventricosum TaxID=4639 RepID=A0A426ZZE8_ENSVE|nr:hypothetical protein B296_00037432 [Ensete ventricosum]
MVTTLFHIREQAVFDRAYIDHKDRRLMSRGSHVLFVGNDKNHPVQRTKERQVPISASYLDFTLSHLALHSLQGSRSSAWFQRCVIEKACAYSFCEPAHEEHDNEQDEREVMYSLRAEDAQSGAPTRKMSHKERLTTVETRLDVLEVSLEKLYQGQRRLLGVENLQEEAESRIYMVESLVDRLIENTKDSVRYLHKVVAKLMTKIQMEKIKEIKRPPL